VKHVRLQSLAAVRQTAPSGDALAGPEEAVGAGTLDAGHDSRVAVLVDGLDLALDVLFCDVG
jgi:hypothetical protein